jgi:hypothetical protein
VRPSSLRVLMVQVGTAFALVEDYEKALSVGCGEIATEVRMEVRRFLPFKLRVRKVHVQDELSRMRVRMAQVDTRLMRKLTPLAMLRLQRRYVRSFYDRGGSRTKDGFHNQGGNQMRGNIACTWCLNQSNFPTEMQHMVGSLSSIQRCSSQQSVQHI